MERFTTGSAAAVLQRAQEFLVPKFFGAVALDESGSTPLLKFYEDAEMVTQVLQIPVASSGAFACWGAGGVQVANVSGSYGMPVNSMFFVSENSVIVATPGSTANAINMNTQCEWLFAKDENGNTVATYAKTGSSAGIGVLLPGVQVLNDYDQRYLENAANIANCAAAVLVPCMSIDTAFAARINDAYCLLSAQGLSRDALAVLSVAGVTYDVVGVFAIPRTA